MKVKPLFVTLSLFASLPLMAIADPSYWQFAQTPPMGWNSWDIFGTTVTEKQAREQADAMAEKLLPAGYDVLTVDIQWYEPNAVRHAYDPNATLTMDEYGRLTPALNRFPSAADGKGFKPLADYVHSKGLRYGIHIMRGIPKQAVEKNLPVWGTNVHAKDIAIVESTCPWNPDMYGVDATKPEGQAYYDSIIGLYASWGVDYIKVDDIARPYDAVQQAEIEAIRKAIDNCGRPIVLSLSPGATPIEKGNHVMHHANLWRITDDFWDRWGLLHAMFERVDIWTPYRRPGAWPDADMIPLGIVDFDRPTNFTEDEQYTLMTLWSIARSPLIFGGDMTRLDDLTLELLTNPEMLEVNQNSTHNRQVFRENNLVAWVADVPGKSDKYVALFNAQSMSDSAEFANAQYASPVIAGKWKSQEMTVNVRGASRLVLFVNDGGDGAGWDHAFWQNPVLHGPSGDLDLTELEWSFASCGWGAVSVDHFCDGNPAVIEGESAHGIGTHAESKIFFDLPEGHDYETFTCRGVMNADTGSVIFAVLAESGVEDISETSRVSVDFEDIGLEGVKKARVYDLWSHELLGEFEGFFGQELRQHASGLYRISPIKEEKTTSSVKMKF